MLTIRQTLQHGLMAGITLTLCACSGGGGGGGGTSGTTATASSGTGTGTGTGTATSGGGSTTGTTGVTPTGQAPTFSGSTSIASINAMTSVSPGASDPDGDSMSFTWTYRSGPLGVPAGTTWGTVSSPDATGASQLRFPMNGSYVMRVTANDGNGNTVDRDITITVNATNAFSLNATVRDTVNAVESGKAGVSCQLQWDHLSSNAVSSAATNSSGVASFSGLIGDAQDFEIVVPGSP